MNDICVKQPKTPFTWFSHRDVGSTSIKFVMKLESPLTTTLENEAFTITGGAPWANSIDSMFIGSVGGKPSLEIPVLIRGRKSSNVCNMKYFRKIMMSHEWSNRDISMAWMI